jgi:hypothetical protein
VHRVERSNTQKYLKDCRKECTQESFETGVASESLGGSTHLTILKGRWRLKSIIEVKFQWKNTGSFRRSCQGGNERSEFSEENSRSHGDHRIQSSYKVDRGGQTHHFGIQNQQGLLIVIYFGRQIIS